ncbi:MAG: superfamily I DNA and RNA helicase [Candidatus Nanosalina sp. J07AB43]|nr:MAG: superfamily I DNA and RNA helicase [Candidatus Nanosalina sp. J07AB43]
MGLEEFQKEEKTSSPNQSGSPSSDGVNDFLSDSDEQIEVSGGYSIPSTEATNKDTEVVKIFGGPGTGKTTTMVGNTNIDDFSGILQRMFEQRNPEEMLLIAYTRAAADEAKRRLVSLTDVSKSKADERVTTIHSMAMRFNNLKPKDIVEIRYANDKYNFCNDVGLEYQFDNGDDDDGEMLSEPDDQGHVFFKVLSWLKSKLEPPEDYEKCPLGSAWQHSDERFVELAEEWDEYKSDKGIWEFDDAILECVNNEDTVDTRFLFVDEVQDLYPLQQAFLDNQFGHVDRIFLAGDDDQTIYEWAGAKPEYFLNMEGNVNNKIPELWDDKTGYWEDEGVYILDQSWRMPNDILELAKMVIDKVDERQEKQIKPHHEGGEFVPLKNPTPQEVINLINPDDTMILFRAKYQMSEFGKSLIKAGIPYKDRFKTWKKEVLNLRDGLAALKNDKRLMTGSQAARVIEELPKAAIQDSLPKSKLVDRFAAESEVATNHVIKATRYNRPTDQHALRRWTREFVTDDMNYYRQMAVRNNLSMDNEHLDPEGVELETIHGSKGQEADTIILSTETTQSVLDNMPKRWHDRRRTSSILRRRNKN